MKNYPISFCAGLLAIAIAPGALSQTYTKKAELEMAATGETFKIGAAEFRVVPGAVVLPATADTDLERDVVVGRYVIEPQAAPAARASAQPAVAGENLGAALSSTGNAVVIAPELNLYFSDIGVVNEALRTTGGKLLYSSQTGGKATIGYASVAEAMQARQRLLGQAGVKEVSPRLMGQRQVAW